MKVLIGLTAITTCLLTAAAVPTTASSPLSDAMGVYCSIDKVVLEPEDTPLRAQVHGVCAIANDEDWYFQPPARGYFYFSAPAGRETTARTEWADIKSVAGTGQVVGFGRRYHPVGRFRATAEQLAKPDVYPIHLGVLKAGTRMVPEVVDVVAKIKAFKSK